MFLLPLAFQLLAAAPHATVPLAPRDSAALLTRVKDEGFWFVMGWRWQMLYDERFPAVVTDTAGNEIVVRAAIHQRGASTASPPARGVVRPALPPDTSGGWYPPASSAQTSEFCHLDWRTDYVDQHQILAHKIDAPRVGLSLCPTWRSGPPLSDDPALLDRALTREGRDTVRVLRRNYLRVLDSAARALPGDHWIVGQRVRFFLDQDDVPSAQKAAAECRAEPWWCAALAGYVHQTIGETREAEPLFDKAHQLMPLEVRCVWDDIGPLLLHEGRVTYEALPCARRDSINRVAWWLADPLFVQDGNDRHAEQMARQTIIALHSALDVDLWQDWRDTYQGPVMREAIMRYGIPLWEVHDSFPWPGDDFTYRAVHELHSAFLDTRSEVQKQFPLPGAREPVPFRRGDSRDVFLGTKGVETYAGPQFHLLPDLRAILDPLRVGASDWDLAPGRADPSKSFGDIPARYETEKQTVAAQRRWDGSWWAPEFYRHRDGPLVPVEYQVGFFRRDKSPVLAAAMAWDTEHYAFIPPVHRIVLAAITMTGPDAPRVGATETIAASEQLSISAAVAPGRSVLSLEMVPSGEAGTTGRARFGIDGPAPLSSLQPGEIALSDPILVRAANNDALPVSAEAVLGPMLGSTRLDNPSHVGVFWEAYGMADQDTVDVTVRVVHRSDANAIRRAAASVGVGRVSDDSIAIRWKEPRASDPAATTDGGVTVRPRGIVLDMSSLVAGDYYIEVTVTRGSITARSRRDLSIARR